MSHADAGPGRARWTPKQVQLLVLLQLIFIFDGVDMQIIAVALPAIVGDWNLPLSAFGLAMAAGHAGSFVGAPVVGMLADRWGRKPVIIAGALLFGTMTMLLALARDPQQLVLLRFIAGLGLGGSVPPALALVTESMPAQRRGLCVALSMVCPPIGIALAGVLAKWLIPAIGWEGLFLTCGLAPIFIVLLLIFFLPESPAFLALRSGNEQKLAALLKALGLEAPSFRSRQGDVPFLASFGTIFAAERRVAVAGLFAAFFFGYLTMSLVLGWLPSMFTASGYPHALAATSISIFSLAGIAGVLATGWLIMSCGERLTTNILIGGGIIAALLLGLTLPAPELLQSLPLVSITLLSLLGMTMNGLVTALYTGASSLFPPHVRSSGIGLGSMVGRSGAMFGGLVGPFAIGQHGPWGFFLVGAILLGLAMLGFNLRRQRLTPSPLS